MSPCSPSDVFIQIPDGPSGPPIPGFGVPFALKIPDISPIPDGFPEDLLDLFDKFQFLIPPGVLKPTLNPNFSKDIFDTIMSMLDKFFPFLMLYKFFLPVLNLIICIIEVLCAIPNPFKLIRAMRRLFRNCIPAFLNLFPIFALIIMIISLLLLLLALIEYIISQILKLIEALLRNINALVKSFSDGDQNSVLAIAKKLGSLLCIFQNLFVLLSIFNIIIEVIRNMLSLSFSIPPCDDSGTGDADGCCTPDVCPTIVKSPYTRASGNVQYLNQLSLRPATPIPGLTNFGTVVRQEGIVIYDPAQEIGQAFINIVDGYDVPLQDSSGYKSKPVFFPTDVNYNSATSPRQAAYTVDLRLYYNPANWGRTNEVGGSSRFIKFTNCIVTDTPTRTYTRNDGTVITVNDGVLPLAGGLGYEDDGVTILRGFGSDGITPISNQATLENFIHKAARYSVSGNIDPVPADGYVFDQVQYTFRPNLETLLNKQLITLGCEPSLALNKAFINSAFAGDAGIKGQLLGNLVNGVNGKVFPNPNATLDCLQAALSALRSNLTTAGVAQFQAATAICLGKLQSDTKSALVDLVNLGYDACGSDFNLNPPKQFTSKPIAVKVNIKERNGISVTAGMPQDIGDILAKNVKAHITFGKISNFIYDGYQAFTADITSQLPGKGTIMISFDNNILCTNTIPADNTVDPTHTLQAIDYQFVYSPVSGAGAVPTADGDSEGVPYRDGEDISREGN
jgi:hypothetical protein